MQIVNVFQHWVGWGWGLTFLVWLLGAIVILTTVQRYFLERTGSRRLTIVDLRRLEPRGDRGRGAVLRFRPPGRELTASSGWAIRSGWSWGWESSIPAIDAASLSHAVSGATPKRSSTNRRMEEKSYVPWSTNPGRRPGRYDQRRHARSQHRSVSRGRRHVVEEPAILVPRDDEHAWRPRAALHQGVHDGRDVPHPDPARRSGGARFPPRWERSSRLTGESPT